MDYRKAFNFVNHIKMFNNLIKRNIIFIQPNYSLLKLKIWFLYSRVKVAHVQLYNLYFNFRYFYVNLLNVMGLEGVDGNLGY